MSATGRSDVRHPADYYATPAWCVRALLAEVIIPEGLWLEPCAGDGAIVRAVREVRPEQDRWSLFELRRECEADLLSLRTFGGVVFGYDFLTAFDPRGSRYAAVVSNPPYSLAEEFVRACLPLADVTCMLLRLNWLGSQRRASFLRENPPSVYVLPRRPSFTGGGTDACEYAWFVWRKYWAGNPEVRVLNPEDCR